MIGTYKISMDECKIEEKKEGQVNEWMDGWTYSQEGELQVSYPPQTIFLIDGPPIPEEKNAAGYNKKLKTEDCPCVRVRLWSTLSLKWGFFFRFDLIGWKLSSNWGFFSTSLLRCRWHIKRCI